MRLLPNTASWAVVVVSVAWFLQPWFDADLHVTFTPKYTTDVFVDVCEGAKTRLFPSSHLLPSLMLTSDALVILSAVSADNSSATDPFTSNCGCGACSTKPTQLWWCLAANQHGSELNGAFSPQCVPIGADPALMSSGNVLKSSLEAIIDTEVTSQVLLRGVDVGSLVLQSIVLVSFSPLSETHVQTVESAARRFLIAGHPAVTTESLTIGAIGKALDVSSSVWPASLTATVSRNETRMKVVTNVVVSSPMNGAWLNSERFDIVTALDPPTPEFHHLCLYSVKEDGKYTLDNAFERFGGSKFVKYHGSPLVAASSAGCLNPGGQVASSTSMAAAEVSLIIVAMTAVSTPIALAELVFFRFNLGGAIGDGDPYKGMSQFRSDVTRLRLGLPDCIPGRKRLSSEPRCLYPSIGKGGVTSIGGGRMIVDIVPVSLAPVAVNSVPDHDPSLHLKYAVVLVGAPDDSSNPPQSLRAAWLSTYFALKEAGRDVVRVVCANLAEGCATAAVLDHRQTIIIGNTALSAYLMEDGSGTRHPALLPMALIPANSVILNFEHITSTSSGGFGNPSITERFVRVHQQFSVWDCSVHNVLAWKQYWNVTATPVPIPMGSTEHDRLLPFTASHPLKDIDVLYIGRENARISGLLAHLQSSLGITLAVHSSLQHGEEWLNSLRRAKIVLMLQQVSGGGEFQATILSSVFAHGGFLIAERMGLDDDLGVYRQLRGFIEVEPVHVVAHDSGYALNGTALAIMQNTISFYLRSSAARIEAATVAHATYHKLRMSTLMLPAVKELERRRAQSPLPKEPVSSFAPKLAYAVVLAASPGAENKNIEVFDEIAFTVYEGLRELGRDAILILCPHLGEGCANETYSGSRQVIIVGSNALQLYMSKTDASLVAITWGLVAKSAILYNFEHVVPVVRNGRSDLRVPNSWITPEFLEIHRAFRVWDYSYANSQDFLNAYGIAATVVPMGSARNLEVYPTPVPEPQRDIDVLFIGTSGNARNQLYAGLVHAGINVTWPDYYVDGPELTELLKRTKILFVMRAFSNEREFKMSRLMIAFSHRCFIVSEAMGIPQDMGYYRPGIVEVEAAQYEMTDARHLKLIPESIGTMVATLKYYLAHPNLRDEVAVTGQRLFRSRTMADALAPVISSLEAQVAQS